MNGEFSYSLLLDESSRDAREVSAAVDPMCASFEAEMRDGQRPMLDLYLDRVDVPFREHLFRRLLRVEQTSHSEGDSAEAVRAAVGRYPELIPVAESAFGKFPPRDPTPAGGPDAYGVTAKHAPGPITDNESLPLALRETAGVIAAADAGDEIPRQFGDYEIMGPIGRGGMGVVYRARQSRLNRQVALKMIRAGQFADKVDVQRFHAEAEAAALLDHSGIVPVYEAGEACGRHYLAMAFVEGETLAARIARQLFSPPEAAIMLRKIAEAVAYAHERRVIHRDLKPANILIDSRGWPKVTDFGLAKHMAADSDLTSTGQILGTPSFMSPEQAAGKMSQATETADVYSLGAILYAMLCGRPPFQADSLVNTLQQVINQEPVPPRQLNAGIPIDLETICLKCLEKDPQRRYASAELLAEELGRFLSDEPIQARPVSALERGWRWCKRKPALAGMIALVLVSLIVGTTVSTYFAILAQQRAQRALEGTQIALRTLESVIFNVQVKLNGIPAAREIRRELLKEALDDLQKVSAEFQPDRVDLNSAVVMSSLGELIQTLGDEEESPNVSAAAEEQYRRAAKVFERLERAEPNNPQVLNHYSKTLGRLALLHTDAGRLSDALAESKQSLMLSLRLTELEPQNTDYAYDLTYAYLELADVMVEMGQREESLPFYERAETTIRALAEQHPAAVKFRDRLADCLEKKGDVYYAMGDNEKAGELYLQAFPIYEEVLQATPNDAERVLSLSTSCERVGDYYVRVNRLEDARKMYERELELSLRAIELDPNNLRLRSDLVVAYDKVRKISQSLGDEARALWAAQQAQDLRGQLKEAGL